MAAINGITSFFVPGLGHMVSGDGKTGLKYYGKNVAYKTAAIGSAILAMQLANRGDVWISAYKTAGKSNPTLKKAAAIGAAAVSVVAAGAALVNHYKSIVSAGKIRNK